MRLTEPDNELSGSGLTPKPRFLGYHADTERQIFLLTSESLAAEFVMPNCNGGHFNCFCAMDATALTADELGGFCSRLLRLGCACLCAWGPDCERVHDIMDEQVIGGNPPWTEEMGCVMTTWHADDSLTDALYFSSTAPIQTRTTHPRAADPR